MKHEVSTDGGRTWTEVETRADGCVDLEDGVMVRVAKKAAPALPGVEALLERAERLIACFVEGDYPNDGDFEGARAWLADLAVMKGRP